MTTGQLVFIVIVAAVMELVAILYVRSAILDEEAQARFETDRLIRKLTGKEPKK